MKKFKLKKETIIKILNIFKQLYPKLKNIYYILKNYKYNIKQPLKIPKGFITEGKIITSSEIREIIKNQTSYSPNLKMYIGDLEYKTTDVESMKLILTFLNISKYQKYKIGYRDCDDYAFILQGILNLILPDYAIGIVWGSGHAMLFMISNDGDFWYIEPQNDLIFKNSSFHPYLVVM